MLVAAVFLAATSAVPISNAGATPVDDQRAKIEAITDRLEELEERADILAEDYAIANARLEQVRVDIADTEERIMEKSAETDVLRTELTKVAVNAYMHSGNTEFNPLFSTMDNATDGLQRVHLTTIASDTGVATNDQLDDALAELDDEHDRLADQRDDAADESEKLDSAKAANDEQKTEYETARAAAETELGDLIRQEEERRARESYERMQRDAEAAQAAASQAATSRAAASQAATGNVPPPAAGPPSPRTNAAAAPTPAVDAPVRSPIVSPPPPPDIPASSSRAGTAINAAMSQLGVPWVFAMAEPGVGFDCSGLTSWAWAKAGVSMPHQSAMQYDSLPRVPISAAQPGDLLFYYSPISHVGIYLGDGKLVHAPNSGSVVNVATVNWNKVVGVARPG